jgi:hypothetical protein
MHRKQHDVFQSFNLTFDVALVQEWEGMVQEWDEDNENPCPYEVTIESESCLFH